MKKRLQRNCAYCGQLATTDEHIVAKSLLIDKNKPLIVPACILCNNLKSRDDEYLRDMFALRIETALLPEMREKREKAERSALNENKVRPSRKMLSTFKMEQIVNQHGDLQHVASIEVDSSRIFNGLKWIVRGLHFYHRNQILSPDLDFKWWAYLGSENHKIFQKIWSDTNPNTFSVGDCLLYQVTVVEELPEFSNWLLAFYNRIFFIISIEEDKFWSLR